MVHVSPELERLRCDTGRIIPPSLAYLILFSADIRFAVALDMTKEERLTDCLARKKESPVNHLGPRCRIEGNCPATGADQIRQTGSL